MKHQLIAITVLAAAALTTTTPAGAQAATCGGQAVTIFGTAGNDRIDGTPGPDVIHGLQGDDRINGLDGDDIICGGTGHDVLIGENGFDIIYGAQGNDLIISGGEAGLYPPEVLEDTRGARIFAGAGNDIVYGSDRWDRMQGGTGNDILFGFGGRDWMRGGAGNDKVLGHGNIDDVHGGNGNDWIAADTQDVVRGGAGNDLCPALPIRDKWIGCNSFLSVDHDDPTLPSLNNFPDELTGGAVDNYIYRGYDSDGDLVYAGITNDLSRRAADHERDGRFIIWEIAVTPLTKGQARSVEQALIEANPLYLNSINSISPTHAYYDAAVAWGNEWIALNAFEHQKN